MMSHFIVTGTIILADICFIVKRLHIAHKIGDRFEKWMMRTFFCGKKLPCIIVHYYCHMCVLTFQAFGGCLFMGSMKNTIVIHFFLFEMPRCIHNTAATLFVMCQGGLEKVYIMGITQYLKIQRKYSLPAGIVTKLTTGCCSEVHLF